MSTQLVLNKYNTNYEALRLADSTALAFKCWQYFIKAFYYELMNYLFDEILYHMSYISDMDHVCYISKQKEKRSKEMKRG